MNATYFLKWGQQAFSRFSVVPPGTGICHQVNLEYLGKAVWSELQDKEWVAYPDTLVGTDSHTTMINGLGVLGWGVGGIEAEAAMLGQPVSMLIPDVVGFKLTGKLSEGITATDLVLTVTQMLRKHGVVGKFVEFYGDGLDSLPLADRATIANMAPEYGATCGFFPIDERYAGVYAPQWSQRGAGGVSLRPTPKRRACGVTRVTSRYLPVRWSWIWAPLRQASQGQNVRRTASPLSNVPKAFAASNELEVNAAQKDHRPVDYVAERASVSSSLDGRRGDCRYHLLYQHVQPECV